MTPLRMSAALLTGAVCAACAGGGGISVGTSLDERARDVSEVAAAADVVFGILDAEPLSDDVLDEFTLAEVDSVDDVVSAGPDGAAVKAWAAKLLPEDSSAAVSRGDRVTQDTRFHARGRLRYARVQSDYDEGVIASVVVEVYLTHSSTTDVTGDLDDTPTPARGGVAAYMYATVTATTTFRAVKGRAIEPGRMSGWRHWHGDPAIRFLAYDFVTTLPRLPRAPYRSLERRGEFGVRDPDVGTMVVAVEFVDGSRDRRDYTLDRRGGLLHVDFTRTASPGAAVSGTLSVDDNDTRECRLDDSGNMAWTRHFSVATTGSDAVTTEATTAALRPGWLRTDVVVVYADGSTGSSWLERRTVSPSGCGDTQRTRQYELRAHTLAGRDITVAVTQELDYMDFRGEHALADGGRVTVTGTRRGGLTDLAVVQRDAAGATVATLAFTVDPAGRASGQAVRRRPDGSEETLAVSRDLNGHIELRRADRADGPVASTLDRRHL